MSPPLLAAGAFGLGIATSALGPLPAAPLAWVGAVGLALLASPRPARAFALWVALGGLLAARAELADRRARAGLVGVDDAAADRIVGEVVGPIDESPAGWRFRLDTAAGRFEVAVGGEPGERCGDDPCGVPDLLPGDRIAIEGRLRSGRGFLVAGAIDGERQLAARGAIAVVVAGWSAVERRAIGGPSPGRWAARSRRGLARRLAGPDREHGLLAALVLGARGALDPGTADSWRDAGMSHLLAVSGMHLAAIALLGYALLRRLIAALVAPRDPGRAAALLAAPLAAAYTAICGASPSALRALVALLIYFTGVALGRRARALDVVGLAALVLLALRPAALFNPSLQLSLVATLAVALAAGGARPLEAAGGAARRAVRWLEHAAWAGLRTSLAASAATAPLTAAWFGMIQPGGVIANLVAAPLTELVALPLGLAAALLGAVGAPLAAIARAALTLADVVAQGTTAVVPPWWCGAPRPHELAVAAATLAGVALARDGRVRATAVVVGGGVLAASWLATAHLAPRWRAEARVSFVDVGQGDAALIELPGGGAWLIDAGGRPSVPADLDAARRRRFEEAPGAAVLDLLGARRIRALELVVLSHPHPDHYLGLRAIARRVPIAEVWLAAVPLERPLPAELAGLLAELADRGTRVVAPPLGPARRHGRVRLSVLAPGDGPRAAGDPFRSVNDDSLVIVLEVGARRVLFAGDLEEEGEAALLAATGRLPVDVVKVPHHGSRTSSTAALVAATRPGLAIVSCGPGNRFGFPAPEVVARWRAVGAAIRRTDQRGTITVTIGEDDALDVDTER